MADDCFNPGLPGMAACEICGTMKNVDYIVDPYIEDVYNEMTMRWLCDDCWVQRKDDIFRHHSFSL